MTTTDVLIVGGGIAGASLGAAIAGRRRTMLVEAEDHCGYHSTGRSAAFWLASYGGPAVARLTTASRSLLADPPAEFHDRSFLRPRGALHLAEDRATADFAEIIASAPARAVGRAELEALVPGIRPRWTNALFEQSCADIDVGALHGAYLRAFRQSGGSLCTSARLVAAERSGTGWRVTLADERTIDAAVLVNAAGAWADEIARLAGARPLGIVPKRRTMVQLRVGQSGLRDLPLVADAGGLFYFKGEGDRTIWLSPHDEGTTPAIDVQPEEVDVATAIDRFEQVVDWPVEALERRWAGLRSFAPDRLPVYGFDRDCPAFFWCAGQGGFGIQTAPAAARLAAALLLGEQPDAIVAAIDPAAFSPTRF